MQVSISGKQIDLGDSFRAHVEARVSSGVSKYFNGAIDAHVVVSHEAHLFRTDYTVHVGTGIDAQAHASADDVRASFDLAAEHLEKQLRRHKRKLRDHHRAAKDAAKEE